MGKKLVRFLSVALALGFVGCTSATTMLESKSAYDKYYQAIMDAKAEQERLNKLPLELKSIDAQLVDGKEYYTDGLAAPTKDDVMVTAHFSEKGKDFDKILGSDEFDMNISSDFAENGGTIEVSYTFVPEKADESEADPEPVIKTTSFNVELTRVALKKLVLEEKPYRIYYSDAMEFDTDGMTCLATYNNGRTVRIPASKLEVETKGKLTAGAESATVSYTLDDVKLTTEVPVTVVSADEYEDGEIWSLRAEGETEIVDGSTFDDVELAVRATYANGNRLLLDRSEYDITGNTATATFAKNCVLTCVLKANRTILCKGAAKVVYVQEAETATLTNATAANVGGVEAVNSFAEGASISFNVNASALAKGKFYIRLANCSGEDISLKEVLTLKVGDREYGISPLLTAQKGGETATYTDYLICSPLLFAGDNTITLTVAKDTALAIDSFKYVTRYEGTFYSSMGEYIELNEKHDFVVEAASAWGGFGGKAYLHGLATDEQYVYGACTSWSDGLRNIVVVKIDPTTGTEVARSKPTAVNSNEAFAGVTYLDGKVIMYAADGTQYYTDADLENDWQLYDGFQFEELGDAKLKDAAYVASRQIYVLRSDNTIMLFNKAGEKTSEFGISNNVNGGTLKRVSVVNDYIFAVYTADGKYYPIVSVYNFEGKLIRTVTVEFDTAEIFGPIVTKLNCTNVQGLVALNDTLYFSVLKWQQGGDAPMLIKVDYPAISEDLTVDLTPGESLEVSEKEDKVVVADGKKVTTFEDIGDFAMGGVSDGEYLYLANNTDGNTTTTVYKVDPETLTIVGKSRPVRTAEGDGDNGRLFIKGDKIYVVPNLQGKMFCANLADFDGGAASFEECAIPMTGLTWLKDATWNESVQRYAGVDNNTLHICNADGTELATAALGSSGMKVSSVDSDEKYIYVSYCTNNQAKLPIDVFDWLGNKVGTIDATGINMGTDAQGEAYNYNVQSLFMHDGLLYASVCTWQNSPSKYHMFKITVKVVEEGGAVTPDPTPDPDPDPDPEPDTPIVESDLTPGAYFEACKEANVDPRVKGELVKEIPGVHYTMGGVSDGTYLYISLCSTATTNRTSTVYKLDPATYEILAQSTAFVTEESGADVGRLFIKGDTLYLVPHLENKLFSVKLADFTGDTVEFTESVSPFTGLSLIKDADFNAKANKYVVLSSANTLYFYTADGVQEKEIALTVPSGMGKGASSVTCDDTYIYVTYAVDNQTVLPIDVYKWDGTKVGTMNATGVVVPGGSYNIQFLFASGEHMYAGACTWASVRGLVYKIQCDASVLEDSGEEDIDTTVPVADVTPGAYVASCVEAGKEATGTVSLKSIAVSGYSMGAVSDGTFLYLARNTDGNNTATIYKVNPKDFSVVAESAPVKVFTGETWEDSSRLFIKDGKIYIVPNATGKMFVANLADFKANKKVAFTETTSILDATKNYMAVAYNATKKQFVASVRGDNNLYIYNEAGEVIKTIGGTATPHGITTDDNHIYMNYKSGNGATSMNVYVYDWSGNTVGTLGLSGIALEGAGADYNMQAIVIHKGTLYASACSWKLGGYHLYQVTLNK